MRVATIQVEVWCLLGLLFSLSCLQLNADDRNLRGLSIKELSPQLVDQEVTITFRSLGTQGISQVHVEGKTPTFALEPEQLDRSKNLQVWIGGELAEIVDRFGFGIGVPKIPPGTQIEVTGKFEFYRNDNVEYYSFRVNDWKKFRILSYPRNKKENSIPIAPRNPYPR